MVDAPLSPEQEAEVKRLATIIGQSVQKEVLKMARLLLSKPDSELLGKTEFEIRDHVHRIGAEIIQTALEERKKGGTLGRA